MSFLCSFIIVTHRAIRWFATPAIWTHTLYKQIHWKPLTRLFWGSKPKPNDVDCVSSHMADHVEQWAQRPEPGMGEMWSGLENVILLNMHSAFWKDVNLAFTPYQTDVREHTRDSLSPCGSFVHIHSGCHFHTFNPILGLGVILFVCILVPWR